MCIRDRPYPKEGDKPTKAYREIPLAIQDRSFNADGSLFYPDTRAFFDELPPPYIPASDVSPVWNPEFFGNAMMVNGRTWPFLQVEQARYRFRVLNGCGSRFRILDFASIPGVQVHQVGSEGGFLASPVDVMATAGGKLLMAPAERADLIVDFAAVPIGSHVLTNVGPDAPFGGGAPGTDFDPADPATTGRVMQFRVIAAATPDPSTPAAFLTLPTRPALPAATVRRPLALIEHMSSRPGHSPIAAMLGDVEGDPNTGWVSTRARMWMDPISQNPALGATEIWEFYNTTADAHPIHVHEVAFEVLDRHDEVPEAAGALVLPRMRQEVEYRRVGFRYADGHGEVLREVSFCARPGEVLAIGPMLNRWNAMFVATINKANDIPGKQCQARLFRVNRPDNSDAAVVQPWPQTRKGAQGAAVAAAEITVSNVSTGAERKAETNEAGSYTRPLPPPGGERRGWGCTRKSGPPPAKESKQQM